MRSYQFILPAFIIAVLLLPTAARADLRLYVGNLVVVSTSGKACEGVRGQHQVSLVLSVDDEQSAFTGLVGGDSVTVGRLSGSSLEQLAVRYPYSDPGLAEGHSMKISISGAVLSGELRDKHIDAAAVDCNFDLARLTLRQSQQDDVALSVFQQLSAQYDAQLARSAAISSLRSGASGEAARNYEKALALADKAYPQNPSKLAPYLTGLANSYMRLGRFADFISLYADRFPGIKDEAVKMIFNEYLIKSQLHLGRYAMGREEYSSALDHFRKALAINGKNKEAIAAIMSAYVRSGQHDEAITFLEQTQNRLGSEPDQRDVRGAIALMQYQKARKEDRDGNSAKAEAAILKAISLDPDTVQYQIALARWRHKSGNYGEADSILKKALERFKNEPARSEISAAREKLRLTEMILNKIRRNGG